jgi:hypothetical protein
VCFVSQSRPATDGSTKQSRFTARPGGFRGRKKIMPMTMDERLDHARTAIAAYFYAKGEPERTCDAEYEDTDVSDLIADLLHLQKFLDLRDIDKTLATALMHHEAEQEEHENDRT